MAIEELKVGTIPPSFVDKRNGRTVGVAIAKSPEQAATMFARGDEYLRVWQEMLKRGERIVPVITDPSQTTPEEAIKKNIPTVLK